MRRERGGKQKTGISWSTIYTRRRKIAYRENTPPSRLLSFFHHVSSPCCQTTDTALLSLSPFFLFLLSSSTLSKIFPSFIILFIFLAGFILQLSVCLWKSRVVLLPLPAQLLFPTQHFSTLVYISRLLSLLPLFTPV